MTVPVIDELRAYFEQGRGVCLHARTSKVHYCLDSSSNYFHEFDRWRVGEVLAFVYTEDFYRSLPHRERTDYHRIRLWASAVYLKAHANSIAFNNPGIPEDVVRDAMTATVIPLLTEESNLRPFFQIRDRAVISLCMAPIYPKSHPRYAPWPIVVMKYGEDIGEAGVSPEVLEMMEAQHGSLYDASQLMLPLPDVHGPVVS